MAELSPRNSRDASNEGGDKPGNIEPMTGQLDVRRNLDTTVTPGAIDNERIGLRELLSRHKWIKPWMGGGTVSYVALQLILHSEFISRMPFARFKSVLEALSHLVETILIIGTVHILISLHLGGRRKRSLSAS